MHVRAIADDFRGDFVGLQHGAHQPWCAMTQRRHAIEEMRRVPRACLDRRERFVVGRARVAERHAMPTRHEPPYQIKPAIELRRHRDDPDVGRGALDLGEDVGGGEIGTLG